MVSLEKLRQAETEKILKNLAEQRKQNTPRWCVRMCLSCHQSNRLTIHGSNPPPYVKCKFCGAEIKI